MKNNKKGTDVGASMPKSRERYCLSHLAQAHLNMILKICLTLILVSLVLIYLGAFFDNNAISFLGLGLGATAGIIQARINMEDDE